MSAKPYTKRELDELYAWVKTKARGLPERERTKVLATIHARMMASFGEIAGQLADALSDAVEADGAPRVCEHCGVPQQHVFPYSKCPKTHTTHSWKDSAPVDSRSFVRIHDGRARRRPCPWCPPTGSSGKVLGHRAQGKPPRATHIGLSNGVEVTTGCEWHMRAWVKYSLGCKPPAQRARR